MEEAHMPRALVVDDEASVCKALELILKKEGYEVHSAFTGAEAMAALYENDFDIVYTDLKLPDTNGLDLISHVRQQTHAPQIIVVTGYASIETAVEAIKRGAYDYLTKPLSPDKVRITTSRAIEKKNLTDRLNRLQEEVEHFYGSEGLIGESRAMNEVFKIIHYAAKSDSGVLITGNSGTGKEQAARAIHYGSRRKDKEFVAVNCAAVARDLIESELFGYVKGAFTGAVRNKTGFLEAASGGTLFLDEIAETSPDFQVKLLRVLQQGEFNKVGDSAITRVDIRVIAATNRDFKKAMAEGAFREDLFYRLNVIAIHMPPLSGRPEDIPILAIHFLDKLLKKHPDKVFVKGFSEDALETLAAYSYPGNVRELENAIDYALVFAEGDRITTAHLPSTIKGMRSPSKGMRSPSMGMRSPTPQPDAVAAPPPPKTLREAKYEFERDFIAAVMAGCGGNVSRAARALDIFRPNLQQKLREFNIDPERHKGGAAPCVNEENKS
jgi:DNA-binding NtrC family response regulator